jgi:hypothetical protein
MKSENQIVALSFALSRFIDALKRARVTPSLETLAILSDSVSG